MNAEIRMGTVRKYDLEERTKHFSLNVRNMCLRLKQDLINKVYINQLVRSASSVAANYIEANENLGPNDLKMRIRICRKEAKESRLWLDHIITYDHNDLKDQKNKLLQEAFELEQIFGAFLKS